LALIVKRVVSATKSETAALLALLAGAGAVGVPLLLTNQANASQIWGDAYPSKADGRPTYPVNGIDLIAITNSRKWVCT
jgi:hypothetical protein